MRLFKLIDKISKKSFKLEMEKFSVDVDLKCHCDKINGKSQRKCGYGTDILYNANYVPMSCCISDLAGLKICKFLRLLNANNG